jgi:DNA-binding transcriptional LysR family regulator
MDFDLRQLRHARALSEHGSFARAARAMHLTQPALSRSIQELERRTGIKLFDRARGGVEPTDLGRVFLDHARELLDRAESLDRELALLRGAGSGQLVVGAGTFPSATFVGHAVAAFLRANPAVGMRLVNDGWLGLIAGLRRRELDLIVSAEPLPLDDGDLARTPLAKHQGYFLCRPRHPLFERPSLALPDVLGYPIVSTARLPTALTDILLKSRAGGDAGRGVPDVGCESVALMKQVVMNSDHVLMSTLGAAADEIQSGTLAVLPVVSPEVRAAFVIARLRNRTLPPVADAFVREVVAADRAAAAVARRLEAHHVPGSRSPARRAAPARARQTEDSRA